MGSFGIAGLLQVGLIALLLAIKSPVVQRGTGPDGWAFGAAPGDAADAGGGGAGGDLLIQLPAPSAADASPDLPAIPDLVAPAVPQPEVAPPADVFSDFPVERPTVDCNGPCRGSGLADGTGGGTGGGSGPGTGPGVGPGTGSGSGSGTGGGGSGIRPPAPLTILIPPTATGAVRGKSATVRLQVDSLGIVHEADVVVSSGDKGYDQQLRHVALGWRFRPARDAANRPIPYPAEISFKF